MSQLDQAKKEAKRLLHLAQEQQANITLNKSSAGKNATPMLSIPNLSKAKDVLAIINGYPNWHDYEVVLKKKDYLTGQPDKKSVAAQHAAATENDLYYLQDIPLKTFHFQKPMASTLVVHKPQQSIILGDTHPNENPQTLFNKQNKKWILDQYPVMAVGSTGSGKTEVLLSMADSHMENKEGVIYIDAKGSIGVYEKMFSHAKKHNRIEDLFYLTFMTGSRDFNQETTSGNAEPPEKNSHSIDPINPMRGNLGYFSRFFGVHIGSIMHAALEYLHQKNKVVDVQSLSSFLMLKNLLHWHQHQTFGDIPALTSYLALLGLEDWIEQQKNLPHILKIHAEYCQDALSTLKIVQAYPHVLKTDCSINMQDIFLQRKILLVLLPALEKCPEDFGKIGRLITEQIMYAEKQLLPYQQHFQNILMDDFYYYNTATLGDFNFKSSPNHYVFGAPNFHYSKEKIFASITAQIETFVIMKTESWSAAIELPLKIQQDMLKNLEEVPPIIYASMKRKTIKGFTPLQNQQPGQAVVFCYNLNPKKHSGSTIILNSQPEYYVKQIYCAYRPSPRVARYFLPQHPKRAVFPATSPG